MVLFSEKRRIKKHFLEFFLNFYFQKYFTQIIQNILCKMANIRLRFLTIQLLMFLLANETLSLTLITNEVDDGSKIFS